MGQSRRFAYFPPQQISRRVSPHASCVHFRPLARTQKWHCGKIHTVTKGRCFAFHIWATAAVLWQIGYSGKRLSKNMMGPFSLNFFPGRRLSECASFQISIRRLFASVRLKLTVQRTTGTTKFQMPLIRLKVYNCFYNHIALYWFVDLLHFVWLSLFPRVRTVQRCERTSCNGGTVVRIGTSWQGTNVMQQTCMTGMTSWRGWGRGGRGGAVLRDLGGEVWSSTRTWQFSVQLN